MYTVAALVVVGLDGMLAGSGMWRPNTHTHTHREAKTGSRLPVTRSLTLQPGRTAHVCISRDEKAATPVWLKQPAAASRLL